VQAGVHICSTTSDTQANNHRFLTLEELGELLAKEGVVSTTTSSKDWVQHHFRPLLEKKLAHFLRATEHGVGEDGRYLSFVGVDLLMDMEYNLWVMEADMNPYIY
jgi:hypothetical protein